MKLSKEQRDRLARCCRLTPREVELVHLLFQGVGSTEGIASLMGISTHAVKMHLHMIYTKFGRSSRHEIMAVCLDILFPHV
jgi:DNA-binding CsgD family transcriptional regulator